MMKKVFPKTPLGVEFCVYWGEEGVKVQTKNKLFSILFFLEKKYSCGLKCLYCFFLKKTVLFVLLCFS